MDEAANARERIALESFIARVIDAPVERGKVGAAYREPPEDAKIKAHFIAVQLPHLASQPSSEGLREALERLGSMEAFTASRSIDPHRDAELLARIDFARAACAEMDARPNLDGLILAARQMEADYQTSERHHPNHVLVPLTAFEAMRAALSSAPLAAEGEKDPDLDPKRIAEVLAEKDGLWRTCSGCHETEDGYDVGHYPFSRVFNAKIGGGCGECGGLGVTWDTTSHADMWRELSGEPSPPPPSDGVVRALVELIEALEAPDGGGWTARVQQAVNSGRTALFLTEKKP